jgi:DNA mismatch repair protein MutS2
MFHASAATLAALELPAFLTLLAELATTDVGRERSLALAPVDSEEALRHRRELFDETSLALVDGALVSGLGDSVMPLLSRLDDRAALLDGSDVLQAADLLRATAQAASRVRGAEDRSMPRLAALFAELPDSAQWLAQVSRVLDNRGRVRDDASPALKRLRRQVREVRDDLYHHLQESVSRHAAHLSEETIPLHEGRLVLLLKSGARGQLDGLVHGRSGSGRSFYFEPLDSVDANNQLRAAIDDEAAERARLLGELVEGLEKARPTLRRAAQIVAELDLLQAACRFGELAGARLPDIAPRGELRLCAARHPLLDPALAELRLRALGAAGHRDAMVPLDLELDPRRRMLVITGPNAGGKTVALKTAGLLTLAAQCGLPVPAAKGTRLPLIERLVATVGDEQDLLNERSTFSARLLRLREAWEAAGEGALVLLDELGSGTDPDEGAALAGALLEELGRRGALALVTTHLSRLAAFALETDGADCAAMEFDSASGHPTFRLMPGTPGASEALALARRLGLPAEWLERATAELDPEQRRLQGLLEDLERRRLELAAQLDRATVETRALEAARRASESERDALAAERGKVARRLKVELADFERRVRQRLGDAEARMREELESGRRRGVAAAATARALADPPKELTEVPGVDTGGGPIVVGGRVRHRGMGWEGRLDKLDRGRAEVQVRGKRMRCRADELVGMADDAEEPRAATRGGKRAGATELRPAAPQLAAELMLLGQRVEGALEALDRYLDQALLAGTEKVRVVHGHGTGRLKRAVREHLAGHPAVAAQRPGREGEGGDGATVVSLAS